MILLKLVLILTDVLTYQKLVTIGAQDPNRRHGPHMEDPVCITNASMVWDDAFCTAWHQSRKIIICLSPND